MTLYAADGETPLSVAAAHSVPVPRQDAQKGFKLPPDIRPAPGMLLLVRIAEASEYWSEEAGIVRPVDEWRERTSPYAQIVRVGEDKPDLGIRAFFQKGDYVLVNHSLLEAVEMPEGTFYLAPFSAVKAVFCDREAEK
jgi:hypothetical protein